MAVTSSGEAVWGFAGRNSIARLLSEYDVARDVSSLLLPRA
jgi:hypothetical protein